MKIVSDIDIDFEILKNETLELIENWLYKIYELHWCELTTETREEIIENLLQEFSK